MNFADQVIQFLNQLSSYPEVPDGVGVLNPYERSDVKEIVDEFYRKFYTDNHQRHMIIGINPGRLGAGLTGIPFTDPIRLKTHCKIENGFDPKPELSSKFIYALIEKMGGTSAFYHNFYISSVSPLGFVKDGKNLNYYDIKSLQEGWTPYFVEQIKKQMAFGIVKEKAFVLGMGKNIKFLNALNNEYKLFGELIALPHPRWVMQYRLKRLEEFLNEFTSLLNKS